MTTITVVTGNKNKVYEVEAFFNDGSNNVTIVHKEFECIEPQLDSVEDIAQSKAEQAYMTLGVPLIVDDTGLFISALSGFPGTYAAYVLKTIGNQGILKLMSDISDRKAHFITAVAYADSQGIFVFSGRVDGVINNTISGTNGFGYDAIFSVNGKTLAEMSMNEKNKVSHRSHALSAFHKWYIQNRL